MGIKAVVKFHLVVSKTDDILFGCQEVLFIFINPPLSFFKSYKFRNKIICNKNNKLSEYLH